MAMLRWVFSMATVASVDQDSDRERESPSVITLMVSRGRQDRERREYGSGIEIQTISVLRQLPRKSRIMMPVRVAAINASRSTP